MKEKCELVILLMLCEDDLFKEEFKLIKDYWSKIEKNYPSVKLFGYIGSEEKTQLLEKKRLILVHSSDDLNHTFEKTYKAFNFIKEKYDFDYIFRTNTSTVINIPLLYKFMNKIKEFNHEIIYTSEIYKNTTSQMLRLQRMKVCKDYFCNDIYGRGNGLLISKELANIISSDKINVNDYSIDDYSIGCILNEYHRNNDKLFNGTYLKEFPHAWYDGSAKHFSSDFGTRWCNWDNKNCDFDFIKKFITIQVKNICTVRNSTKELANMKKLYDLFLKNKDSEIEKTLNAVFHYTTNIFDIFVSLDNGYFRLNL